MKVEINPKQKIIVVLDSQEYALTKPTLGMQDEFESHLDAAKEAGKGAVRVMINFVIACGLPEDVTRKLDQDELQAIMTALTPAKKKLTPLQFRRAKLKYSYGLSEAELDGLGWEQNEVYWQALTVIEAQDVLVQFQISDYPNAKRETRRKLHREFHKMAYPKTHDATEVLTTEELGKRIKAALNG